MTKHEESTLNWPPTCPKDGVHLTRSTLTPATLGTLALLVLAAGAWAIPSPDLDATRILLISDQPDSNLYDSVLANVGDFNGDGYEDFIVGRNRTGAGQVSVYFGGPVLDANVDLVLKGESAGDNFGIDACGAGDFNGDGYDDILVGAYAVGPSIEGKAYLFFGGSSPDATADLTIMGSGSNSQLGHFLAGGGDINGDGYSDVVIGVYADSNETGKSHVCLGSGSPDLNPDLTLTGAANLDRFGISQALGDFNGDGYMDIAVGADMNGAGGSQNGYVNVFWGGAVPDGTADLQFLGLVTQERFGGLVDFSDFNGDGYPDLIVSAHTCDGAGADAGRVYVFLGGTTPDTTSDYIFDGENPGDRFGAKFSGLSDVNGDGYQDLAIATYLNDEAGADAGQVYLYLGGPVADTEADLRLYGAPGDHFGMRVSSAGDLNLDGLGDLWIGANSETDYSGFASLFSIIQIPTAQGLEGTAYLSRSGGIYRWQLERESQPKLLFLNGKINSWPVVSPDRRYLAYTGKGDSYADSWVVDEDGQNPTKLATGFQDDRPMDWAGSRILIRAYQPYGQGASLWYFDVTDSTTHNIVGPASGYDIYTNKGWIDEETCLAIQTPRYSASGVNRILQINVGASVDTLWTDTTGRNGGGVSVSHDKTKAVFWYEDVETGNGGHDLYLLDLPTRQVERLTEDGRSTWAYWSPDDSMIIFRRDMNLWVLDPVTGEQVPVTGNELGWDLTSWEAHRCYPAGTAYLARQGDLFRMDLDSAYEVPVLATGAIESSPVPSPDMTKVAYSHVVSTGSHADSHILDVSMDGVQILATGLDDDRPMDWAGDRILIRAYHPYGSGGSLWYYDVTDSSTHNIVGPVSGYDIYTNKGWIDETTCVGIQTPRGSQIGEISLLRVALGDTAEALWSDPTGKNGLGVSVSHSGDMAVFWYEDAEEGNGGPDLYLYDFMLDDVIRLTSDGRSTGAVWSPDDAQLMFIRNSDLWTLDLADGSECQITIDGAGREATFWTYQNVSGVPAVDEAPARTLIMASNYPNPFNPTTTIQFESTKPGHATVEIFDIRGRLIRLLLDADLPEGGHSVVWNGRGETGAPVSSGVYLYRVNFAGEHEMRRVLLLK